VGTLTSWNPLGHSRPVTGLFYLTEIRERERERERERQRDREREREKISFRL